MVFVVFVDFVSYGFYVLVFGFYNGIIVVG